MLKLMKYEWKSVWRQLFPLYLGILGVALVNHFLLFPTYELPSGTLPGGKLTAILFMVYFALCVAVIVLTVITVIQRFYKGLLGQEGYLMFTLPVRPWQLIASKGLVATLLCIMGTIVGILSVVILTWDPHAWGSLFGSLFEVPWGELFAENPTWPLYFVEGILLMLSGFWSMLALIYCSIAVDHLANNHRIAISVVAYFVLSTAQTWLMAAIANPIANLIFDFDGIALFRNLSYYAQMHLSLLALTVIGLIWTAVFFAGTNFVLTKKLNLE